MTTLTEDLAAEKLQLMTNDELLAHLIERLPEIREALRPASVTDQIERERDTLIRLMENIAFNQDEHQHVRNVMQRAIAEIYRLRTERDRAVSQHRRLDDYIEGCLI